MTQDRQELVISPDESSRISVYKVLLSVMVVFIHSYGANVNFAGETVIFDVPAWLDTLEFTFSEVLCGCAVNAFFFLSAYLLYRKPFSWKQNIKKKARSLLVPYFIMNSLWILIFFTAQHIPAMSSFFSDPKNIVANWDLAEWISRYFASPSSMFPMLYPLWFVRELFIMNLLSGIYPWIVKKLGHFSLALFVLVWVFLLSSNVFFIHLQALCFWGMGCYFANRRISISSLDKHKAIIASVYIPLAVAVVALHYSAYSDDSIYRYFHRLCTMTGIAFWFVYATKVKGRIKSIVLSVSKYSFCIFIFHELNLTILRKITTKVVPQTTFFALILYFIIPAIIIGFCILLSRLLEKYMPKVYSLISGGRSR